MLIAMLTFLYPGALAMLIAYFAVPRYTSLAMLIAMLTFLYQDTLTLLIAISNVDFPVPGYVHVKY